MNLLIGAPVHRREWIIRQWLESATASAVDAGVEHSFVLLGGIDDPTFGIVNDLPQYDVARVYVDETRGGSRREWYTPGRLERMVELRNRLLGFVREQKPTWFLSLDTDVLLHPSTIGNLIETQQEMDWAAVGGYCHMARPPSRCPSAADRPHVNGMRRLRIPGKRQKCDVLMAIVLMTPTAYAIDYEWDRQGEDLGWATALSRAGLRRGVDARVTNKHVMDPHYLDQLDPRCGF